jgi:hypothetical protein
VLLLTSGGLESFPALLVYQASSQAERPIFFSPVSRTKLSAAPLSLLPPSKLRCDAVVTPPPFPRASSAPPPPSPLHREKLLFHATFPGDFEVFPIAVVFLAQVDAAGYAPSPPGLRGPCAGVALRFVKLGVRTPSGFVNYSELPTPSEVPASTSLSPAFVRLPHHRPTAIGEPPRYRRCFPPILGWVHTGNGTPTGLRCVCRRQPSRAGATRCC